MVTFCSIFYKRDAFDFHIIDFFYLSENIATALAHSWYTHLIRYSWASHGYDNLFHDIPCSQIDFSDKAFRL